MNLWRLQTNTDSKNGLKIANYCIENNVLAMGWSLKELHLFDYIPAGKLSQKVIEERNNIRDFEDYSEFIKKYGVYGGTVNENVNRFYFDVKENDLIWIRTGGIYYLGRVTEKSHWQFNNTQIAFDLDASNQITDIEWQKIGDESDVPGAITTALIRGKTLQRINKSGALDYSKLIYNETVGFAFYKNSNLKKSSDNFYSMLSPTDCEDLLCLWLYAEYGYITIPSTNKKSTECYECVLKDPKTGLHIYTQVKDGEVDLQKENFSHLNGEIWLLTTKGTVLGNDDKNNIHVANPQTLFEFVGSEKAKNILPNSILTWYKKINES